MASGRTLPSRVGLACKAGGRVVYWHCAVTGAGRALSRLDNIAANGSPTDPQKYVEYTKHLGAATLVELEYPAVTVDSNPLVLTYGGGGTYGGFDEFGRVKDQKWQIKTAGTVQDRFTYGYDHNGTRRWRKNEKDTDFSELYHANGAANGYDGLDRLTHFRRGTLSDSDNWPSGDEYKYDTISADESRTQAFGLDQVGNWTTFKDDATDGGTWDLDQDRAHNDANEIDVDNNHANAPGASITATAGENWVDPKQDAAGNMIAGPRPASPNHTPGDGKTASEEYRLFHVYDAWNRLVAVYEDTDDDGTHDTAGTLDKLIAAYRYDGLHRRIAKLKATAYDGYNVPTTYERTDYYYTANWQVIQECFDDGIAAASKDNIVTPRKAEYVWCLRYIDAPVVRWHDDDDDGNFTDDGEVLYYCNDANMNVTAVMGVSGGTWQVLERYLYDAYGRPRICNADWSNTAVTWANSKKNEILFAGYRYDPETGLYHVRNRPYHPTLGRWTARDLLRYVDGMNLYESVQSAPSGKRDPFGLTEADKEGEEPTLTQQTHDARRRREEAIKKITQLAAGDHAQGQQDVADVAETLGDLTRAVDSLGNPPGKLLPQDLVNTVIIWIAINHPEGIQEWITKFEPDRKVELKKYECKLSDRGPHARQDKRFGQETKAPKGVTRGDKVYCFYMCEFKKVTPSRVGVGRLRYPDHEIPFPMSLDIMFRSTIRRPSPTTKPAATSRPAAASQPAVTECAFPGCPKELELLRYPLTTSLEHKWGNLPDEQRNAACRFELNAPVRDFYVNHRVSRRFKFPE